MTEWSDLVKSQDNYTCQSCGNGEEEVIAHHIKGRYDYPELALAIDNGQSLCRCCHIRIHNEEKPSPCFFPREYISIDGRLAWNPIIPNELKSQYPQYVGVLQ